MVDSTEELTRLRLSEPTCVGLEERMDASLICTSSAEPLNAMPKQLSPTHIVEGKSYPSTRLGVEPNRFRVPVVDISGNPLMPCASARARLLLKTGKAIAKRSKLGIFYLQLKCVVNMANQLLVLGVDSGSCFEGFSVVGRKDTVLNIMSEATTWVKRAVEQRRIMRKTRRYRKTRQRECRFNNRLTNQKRLPPSTKARWDTKLRIISQLEKILPIQIIVIEEIVAPTRKNKKQWNEMFSPLEIGKRYFYGRINRKLITVYGFGTKKLRECFGLKKLRSKNEPVFGSHCVDAWVLAASETRAERPTTRSLYYVVPLRFYKRQLHMLQPGKDGKRKRFGGTISLDHLKRGTLVKHLTHGLCFVGGFSNARLSLHSVKTGKRLTHNAKKEDCKFLTRVAFRTRFLREESHV